MGITKYSKYLLLIMMVCMGACQTKQPVISKKQAYDELANFFAKICRMVVGCQKKSDTISIDYKRLNFTSNRFVEWQKGVHEVHLASLEYYTTSSSVLITIVPLNLTETQIDSSVTIWTLDNISLGLDDSLRGDLYDSWRNPIEGGKNTSFFFQESAILVY